MLLVLTSEEEDRLFAVVFYILDGDVSVSAALALEGSVFVVLLYRDYIRTIAHFRSFERVD